MEQKQFINDLTQNLVVVRYLEREFDYAVNEVEREYLIRINPDGKDRFIKQIAESPPEGLIKIMEVIGGFINYLSSDGIKFNPENKPRCINIDFPHLLRHTLSGNKLVYFHPEMKKAFPKDSLCLCYIIIFSQALLRLLLYLKDHPTAKDALYKLYQELLKADPKSKPYLDEATENLRKFTKNTYEAIIRKEIDKVGESFNKANMVDIPAEEVEPYVWDAITKAFPFSLKESIIKTASGDLEISYVPNAAAMDLIDEYRKHKNELLWEDIQSDLPKSFSSIESVPDIPKLHEVEKASDCAKWIESVRDPIDQAIARLKLDEPEVTVRQIARRLSLSKSNVDRRIQKLKKNKPTF